VRPVLLALALVLAAIGYAWLVPESGFPTWLRLRDEVAQAEERIRTLERQNTALRDEVAALRTDPFAQERAVREELGWVRPGEKLVRMPAANPETERSVP
jgi:cell division protein FtsB